MGVKPRETIGNFRLEITPGLRLRDEMLAKQKTIEWKDKYKIRSGVEATMSELKRAHGLGKLRVRGLARVHFAVVCKVVACNIKRWAAWQAKRSKTRDGVTDGGSGADGGGINGGENHPDRDPSYISSLVKAASILLFRKLSIFPNAA
jgi:Transposase DDE domain